MEEWCKERECARLAQAVADAQKFHTDSTTTVPLTPKFGLARHNTCDELCVIKPASVAVGKPFDQLKCSIM